MADNTVELIKGLLRNCENKLLYSDDGSFIDSRYIRHPRVPLINVFWGGVSDDAKRLVHEVFDSAWMSGSALHDDVIGFIDGELSQESFSRDIRRGVITLLQSPAIFDRSCVYFAHYLNVLSPDYDKELEAACSLLDSFDSSFLPDAYVLLHVIYNDPFLENTALINERIKSTEARLSSLPNYFGFYFGNRLSDGTMLSNVQRDENYTLAADISMLLTTMPDSNGVPANIMPWLVQNGSGSFTASYARMQKPTADIVHVTMDSIVKSRIASAKENEKYLSNSHTAESKAAFWEAMGLNGTKINSIEEYFENNIRKSLPNASSYEFLPNWKKASKEPLFDAADGVTEGFLKLFVTDKFINAVKELEFIDYSQIAADFVKELSQHFDYYFIRDHFVRCADFIDSVNPAVSKGTYEYALSAAKKQFYDMVVPKLKEAMLELADKAKKFSGLMDVVSNNLNADRVSTSSGLVPVDEYYRSKAEIILPTIGDRINSELSITTGETRLTEKLEAIFDYIVDSQPDVYRCTLEDELAARFVVPAAGVGAGALVAVALDDPVLEKQQRIRATGYGTKQAYYIYYGGAQFDSSLKDKGGKFVIGSKNSAERVIITSFSASGLI